MTSSHFSLPGLDRSNLREQAASSLRKAITTGDIPQGKHLVETDLSVALGISRGTLREALRQLQQEGLVLADNRGRLKVRHLAVKEIFEIFQVRSALESLAAEIISANGQRSSIVEALRRKVSAMAAAHRQGLDASIETDLDFHRTLVHSAGNSALTHQWDSLEGSIRMCIMYSGVERAVRNMTPERHHDIVDALETGDAEQARRVIRGHMEIAAETLTRIDAEEPA